MAAGLTIKPGREIVFAEALDRAVAEQLKQGPQLEPKFYDMEVVREGKLVREDVPMRNAMNEVLRDEYIEDCQRGVDRWNKKIAEYGVDFELKLPSRHFHRAIGQYAGVQPRGLPSSILLTRP